MRIPTPPSLVKLSHVAKRLGVSSITVRRRVTDGSLPHIRIKGRLYFHTQDIEAFIARHRYPDRID